MKLNSKDTKHLFSEIAFLLASVLVFRSAWHLLDIYPVFNEPLVLWLSLLLGLALCIPAMRLIIKNDT